MEEGVEQITGFEEFYAELPMKPDEAAEEETMYDTKLSVATYLPLQSQILPYKIGYILIIVVRRKSFKSIVQHVASTSTVNEYSWHTSPLAEFAQ